MRSRVPALVRLAMAAIVLLCAGHAVAQIGPEQELPQLFGRDPAAAYERAIVLFHDAAQREDLDGMMAVLRGTMARFVWADPENGLEFDFDLHGRPMDEMAATIATAAEEAGRWQILGEARTKQAILAAAWGHYHYPFPAFLRALGLLKAADAAFLKAGVTGDRDVAALRSWLRAKGYGEQKLRQDWETRTKWMGPLAEVAIPMAQAMEALDDARVLMLLNALINCLATVEDEGVYLQAGTYAAVSLFMPGTDPAITRIRQVIDQRGDTVVLGTWPALSNEVASSSWDLWYGRDDIYRETGYWVRRHYVPGNAWVPLTLGARASKIARFGREDEAIAALRYYLDAILRTTPQFRGTTRWAPYLLWPGAPTDLRRTFVGLMCEDLTYGDGTALRRGSGGIMNHRLWLGEFERLCDIFRVRYASSPRAWAANPDWALETGHGLASLGQTLQKPEDCIPVLQQAAQFFRVAGRSDLADRSLVLAQQVAAAYPEALYRLALTRAQTAASEGRWEAVLTLLQAQFADQPARVEFIQACVLMVCAHLQLGQVEEANRLFQRAADLIGSVQLSAGERANYCIWLAHMTTDLQWRRRMLEDARSALQGAGLSALADSVDREFASLALGSEDLSAARQALNAVIDRLETQRQHLAFDPLLRQRWFADNLAPYRQLIRVAALQHDPDLALSSGERMRGRALLDQLAWKKADMVVDLAPRDRQRLESLRAMRHEAYELLNRAMGSAPDVDDTRGTYLPIRGLYLPLRGGLQQAEPVAEDDMKRLAQLLDRLVVEEAALESAVRESVPAYRSAASLSIPSGAQLMAQVRERPGVAVLHYTFSDQGLVVVALGASGTTQVAHITKPDRNALHEQIGLFRQAIWERDDDALNRAQALYEILVAPVADALIGASRVWIVADGAIQLVPFAALRDKDGEYLGAHHTLAYAPSLTLALSARGQRPAPSRSAVVVAAPSTGAADSAGAPTDSGRGTYMPIRGMYLPLRGRYMPVRGEGEVSSALTLMAQVPLPDARAEGEAIAAQYKDAKLLTGSSATKSELFANAADCEILHIATHGYADPEFPDFSGLLLAPPSGAKAPYDVLTALEVYRWPLRARLVTLSACQTALGRDVEGEGILGLSRAFIYAGAQDVVCSLWPVADKSTAKLMAALYQSLGAGATVEDALRTAQWTVMQDPALRHPFYWAAFTAVRGPG